MRRSRNIKKLSIIALIVAIIGMSLGFAAFSNILKISSSATVKPNVEDFKIKIYGIGSEITDDNYWSLKTDISAYDSDNVSMPYVSYANAVENKSGSSGNIAAIDNGTLTISNVAVNFTEPGQSVIYHFLIKNEGQYDAYLDLSPFGIKSPTACIAGDETTESLVADACNGIRLNVTLYELDDFLMDIFEANYSYFDVYQLVKNDYLYLVLNIDYYYGSARADGNFAVEFDDIEIDFSTSNS